MADKHSSLASDFSEEVTSSRLAMLSDLMDARKRAEKQEQEFLRTIQRENAGFTQLVKLFHDQVSELRHFVSERVSLASTSREETDAKLAALSAAIPAIKHDLQSQSNHQIELISSQLSDSITSTESTLKEALRNLTQTARVDLENCMHALSSESERLDSKFNDQLAALNSTISSKFDSQITPLSANLNHALKRVAELENEIKTIQAIHAEELVSIRSDFRSQIEAMRTEFHTTLSKNHEEFSGAIQAVRIEAHAAAKDELVILRQEISDIAATSNTPATVDGRLLWGAPSLIQTAALSSHPTASPNLGAVDSEDAGESVYSFGGDTTPKREGSLTPRRADWTRFRANPFQ